MSKRNSQSMQALASAQTKRKERGDLLRQLGLGQVDPVVLVQDPPACIESMLVFDFLRACPHIAAKKLREINRRAIRDGVNLADTLGELPASKREWLVKGVRVWTLSRRTIGPRTQPATLTPQTIPVMQKITHITDTWGQRIEIGANVTSYGRHGVGQGPIAGVVVGFERDMAVVRDLHGKSRRRSIRNLRRVD